MLYKFRSKAGSDVIMMGPHGDELLRIMGREPSPKGILEPADMPAAIESIEQAVVIEAAAEASAEHGAPATQDDVSASPADAAGVSLQRRAWPLLELIRHAHAAAEPVVWGV